MLTVCGSYKTCKNQQTYQCSYLRLKQLVWNRKYHYLPLNNSPETEAMTIVRIYYFNFNKISFWKYCKIMIFYPALFNYQMSFPFPGKISGVELHIRMPPPTPCVHYLFLSPSLDSRELSPSYSLSLAQSFPFVIIFQINN